MSDWLKKIDDVIAAGPYDATWESMAKYSIPQWYMDAKFGIFLHWGVYAVPAFGNEWYPRHMYLQDTDEFKHHVATYGPQNVFGYKDFIPMFKAEKFDPNAWADLFVKAGAKYVIPTAEHHDGFSLYASQLNRWNAVQMGPHRDLIGDLGAAVRSKGLLYGVSTHREEHHWFMGGGMEFDSDVQDPQYRDFYGPGQKREDLPEQDFLEEWLIHTCELVDLYQPTIVWFDWCINTQGFEPYLQKFAAYYYNRGVQWGKEVAINYKDKAFPPGTAVFDVERGQLKDILPHFWQTDTTVSKTSWGYVFNHDYKTTESIVEDFMDIISKNGSLLLNVGPKADGTIPEHEQKMLLQIGEWLSVNGEAVYNTRPWHTFGEGPTKIEEGSFTDEKREPFTSEDIRFTTNGKTFYATVLAWPAENRVTIKSLAKGADLPGQSIKGIELLGSDSPLKWDWNASGVEITAANRKPSTFPSVFKISFE